MHCRRISDITRVVSVREDKKKDRALRVSKKRKASSHGPTTMTTPRNQKSNQQGLRTELDYEIERLKAEIQQEKQMK